MKYANNYRCGTSIGISIVCALIVSGYVMVNNHSVLHHASFVAHAEDGTEHVANIIKQPVDSNGALTSTSALIGGSMMHTDNNNDQSKRVGDSKVRLVDVLNQTNRPVIMFWSSVPKDNWYGRAHEGTNYFKSCQFRCELTRNRSRIDEATLVVFASSDHEPEWPKVRFQNQTYLHFLCERPGPWHEWLRQYDGKINLTWNYRRDADISMHPAVHKLEISTNYTIRVPLSRRNKSVVWAVSHCKASSQRDVYVHELAKYIGVDIYGHCGSLICSRDDKRKCMHMFKRTYKFYLSFENRICQDYITEKLFDPLKYEMIPIVLGGGDYKSAAPPHSYIDVRDFDSPKDLATYLHHLEAHEEEYNAYFDWIKHYYLVSKRHFVKNSPCVLCDVAHNSSLARPAHDDYYNWWFSGCDDSLVDNMRATGKW